eukprot:gene6560-1170_t
MLVVTIGRAPNSQNACFKKRLHEWEELPKHVRGKRPTDPKALPPVGSPDHPSQKMKASRTSLPDTDTVTGGLVPCPHCTRTFRADRVETHAKICAKQLARGTFDSKRHRIKALGAPAPDSDAARRDYKVSRTRQTPSATPPVAATPAASSTSGWRAQREGFLHALNAAQNRASYHPPFASPRIPCTTYALRCSGTSPFAEAARPSLAPGRPHWRRTEDVQVAVCAGVTTPGSPRPIRRAPQQPRKEMASTTDQSPPECSTIQASFPDPPLPRPAVDTAATAVDGVTVDADGTIRIGERGWDSKTAGSGDHQKSSTQEDASFSEKENISLSGHCKAQACSIPRRQGGPEASYKALPQEDASGNRSSKEMLPGWASLQPQTRTAGAQGYETAMRAPRKYAQSSETRVICTPPDHFISLAMTAALADGQLSIIPAALVCTPKLTTKVTPGPKMCSSPAKGLPTCNDHVHSPQAMCAANQHSPTNMRNPVPGVVLANHPSSPVTLLPGQDPQPMSNILLLQPDCTINLLCTKSPGLKSQTTEIPPLTPASRSHRLGGNASSTVRNSPGQPNTNTPDQGHTSSNTVPARPLASPGTVPRLQSSPPTNLSSIFAPAPQEFGLHATEKRTALGVSSLPNTRTMFQLNPKPSMLSGRHGHEQDHATPASQPMPVEDCYFPKKPTPNSTTSYEHRQSPLHAGMPPPQTYTQTLLQQAQQLAVSSPAEPPRAFLDSVYSRDLSSSRDSPESYTTNPPTSSTDLTFSQPCPASSTLPSGTKDQPQGLPAKVLHRATSLVRGPDVLRQRRKLHKAMVYGTPLDADWLENTQLNTDSEDAAVAALLYRGEGEGSQSPEPLDAWDNMSTGRASQRTARAYGTSAITNSVARHSASTIHASPPSPGAPYDSVEKSSVADLRRELQRRQREEKRRLEQLKARELHLEQQELRIQALIAQHTIGGSQTQMC